MKNVKLLVLSDIHLERVNSTKQKFLLSAINDKVEKAKKTGLYPVVVFAGDIHNSTKGYEFIAQVNAQCVYIAGNHEFWEADYYETIEKLKSEAPKNVTFLHNDIVEVGQYIILGTTLWTDIGQSLNKDLLSYAGSRMNDMGYITAKKWYEDENNIKKLEQNYSSISLDTKLGGKKWNALIEIEENQKGWDFLSNVSSIYKAINDATSIKERLSNDLNAKSDWWRITQDMYEEINQKIDITQQDLTWEKFINNLLNTHKNYTIFEADAIEFLKNSEEKDELFQKIRQIKNLHKKEIVILSHHLPFYEEILVGSFMQEYHKVPVTLYNEIDHNIFMVRSGTHYPGFHYMMKASKGDIDRKNDITHIVNYYNDGSNKLSDFLLRNTKLWIHGHEHHFRFSDYVKGIQILANPSGSALSLFDVENDELKLSNYYLSRNKIKNPQFKINQIKDSLVSEHKPFLTKDELNASVKLWALKNFNFNEYKKILKKISQASEKILALSIEYVQSEDEKSSLEQIEEKMSIWYDSYNYNCEKIVQMHEALKLGYSVRTNENFSFQLYNTNSLVEHNYFNEWVMGNAETPQKINEGTIGVFSAKQSFESRENIRIALKHIDKLEQFLVTLNIEHIHQITLEHRDTYEALSKKSIPAYRLTEKTQTKWQAFSDKIFANDKKDINSIFDRDLDRDF